VAYNFSWVVPDRVGGMALPSREDLDWLAEMGVTALVSLTRERPPSPPDIELFHVPIPDMESPSLDTLHAVVSFMRSVVEEGGKVIVHCRAGLGRTGTTLAAYLVSDGMDAAKAIARVRALRPGSIETPEQEAVIREYAELMGMEP